MRKILDFIREFWRPTLIAIGLILVAIVIAVALCFGVFALETKSKEAYNETVSEVYNNGVCPNDNTHYELRGIDENRRYVYVCPKCYTEVEVYK